MAGGGEASVRVPINLEIVNSSLADIKKVLDSLSPNTKNFSALKNIVADMEKSAGAFAQKMSVPFRNKSQFTSAGKDLDKFMAQMEKFNQLRGDLQLGDFKVVDPASLQQLADLKKQLEDAQKEIVKIQEQTLQGLFNNADVSGALIAIDPDITKKSFEEVEAIVNEKVDEINDKIAKIGSENGKAIDIGNKLKDIVGKNFISADVLGEDVFNQFFKKNGAFKAGQQNPFVEYLTQAFALTPDQVNKLKDQSAAQINNILNDTFKNGNRRFFQTQQKRANAAEKGSADLVNSQEVLVALQQVQAAFNTAGAQSEQYRQALANLHNTMDKVTQSSQKQGQAALGTNYNAMAAAVQNYRASLESAQSSLMKLERQQATFNSLKSAITNFMGFTQVLSLVRKGVTDAAAHIKELDTVMNGISIVTDMSTADLWGQVDAYTQLAQKYGTTIKGAYEVSQIYYQQGLKSNQVMALTEETLKLSKISGLDYATTTDYMTTALRGFHMEMEEASRVVDVYSALAANTAVSQQELAEAMTRTASSMEAIGTTFEQASAMIATMVAATRESASNIGSAMKSIGSRYGELTKDPTKLMDSEGEEISFNKVDTALKSVGISMQTADHQFRSFTEVILELSDAWDTLDSRQQRYIATQMAGNRQQSRFLALVSNGDELRRNLEIAENSEGTGSQQALKYLDGLEAKLNQVQTAWQEFYTTIGIEEAWKEFLDSTTQVLNTLNGLPKAFNKIPIAAIGAIATIINAAKTLGTTALGGLSKMIMPYVLAAGQAAEAVAGQEGLKGGQKYNEEFQKALKGLSGGIVSKIAGIFTVAAGALNTLALTMDTTEPKGRKLAGTLTSVSVALQGISAAISFIKKDYASGIMSLVGAFTSGITAFGLFNESAEEKLNSLKESSDNLKNTAEQLKSEERSLTTLKKKYDELEEHRYDSEEAAQAFQDVQNEIAEKFPELVSAYDSVGNATIETADLEQQLANARQESAAASIAAAEAEIRYQKTKIESDRIKFNERNTNLLEDNNRSLQIEYGKQVQTDEVLKRVISESRGSRATQAEFLTDYSGSNASISDDAWLTQVLGNYLVGIIDQNQSTHFNINREDVLEFFSTTGSDHIAGRGMAETKASNLQHLTYLYENTLPKNYRSPIINQILQDKDALQEYNKLTNQLLSRTDYDTEDYKQLFTEWQDTYMEVLTILPEAQRDLGEEIATSINLAQQGIISSKKLIKSLESTGIQQAMNNLIESNQLKNLQESSIYTVFSNKLLSGADTRPVDENGEQIGFEAYVKLYEEDLIKLNTWLEQLDAYERQQFEERLKDRRHYNTFNKLTDGLELGELPIFSNNQTFEEFINGYYNSAEIQARAQQHIAAASGKAQKEYRYGVARTLNRLNEATFNTPAEEEFNNQLINLVNTIGEYNPNFDWDLSKIPAQFSKLSNELQDKLLNNGLLNPEAIEASMKALEDAGEGGSNIYAWLKEIKSELIDNLLLSIQTELDAYTKGADTAVSNIKKLQSGVGFEDLSKILTTLNQYLDDTTGQLSIDDFNFVDGKWTIKLNSLEKVTTGYTKQMSEFDGNFEERMKAFDEARKLIEQINNEEAISDVSILGKAGIADVDKYLKLNKKGQQEWANGNSSTELSKAINDNEKLATQQNELYKAYKESYEANLLQLINDQKRIDKTLTSVINNRKDIQLTDVTKLSDQLGFKNVQAMIDKGFISFVGDRYEATAEQLQKMLDYAVQNGKLTDIQQINNYQAQINKLAQESSPQAALSSIIASPDKVTEEMLVAYANALDVSLDIIKEQFIQNADGKTYIVKGSVSDFIERRGMSASDAATEYANKLYDAVSTVYNGVTSAITNGEASLNNTAEIREVIAPLEQMGIAKLDESLNKWILTVADDNIQEVINAINASDLTQEQKTKNIDSILKAQQSKTFDTVFSSILKDTKNISRDTMQKLADFYNVSVEALLATDAFKFNGQTQAYEVQDKSYLKSILATSAEKISESAYRSLEAQLYVLDNEFNGQAMSFLSNTSLKETDVADILNKYQESTGKNLLEQLDIETVSFSDFINMYFTRDANGNLQIQDNEAFRDLAAQLGLSQEQIQNALIQRISGIISNLSSLSSDIINGFNTPDKMNTVLQELRRSYYKSTTKKGKIIDFDFSDIFEYNDVLNKFVYTQTGIALRVRQLKQQLEQADGNKDAIDAQHQLDMFMAELGQSIDITGYLNLEKGTKEQQKARQELIRNVSNYNAAALEHTDQIAISQEELQEALNGNLTSIENIYKTINKDISSEDLVAIYQQPITKIQGAIDAIEKGGNTIVDKTTMYLLGLSGALDFKNSKKITDGKYQVAFKQSITKLGDSYSILYDALKETTQATTQQLNELAAKIVKNQMSKQQAGIELMSNAAEMTIDQFVDIFTSLGVTVDKNFLAADKWGKYLTLLGGDNLQIKDLSGLIKEQGLEKAFSTEKGKEALQAYADSMIEQGNSMHDRLMQIADDLKNAKIGDQINVAGLGLENNEILKEHIKDGVLTLQDNFIKNVFVNQLLNKDSLGKYLTDVERATIQHTRRYGTSERAYAVAKNITDNWDNVSFEMLTEFAEANNFTMQSVLASFKRNTDGSYSGKGSKVAFATYNGLDDKYIADLRRSANETVDNTISNVIEASIQHLQDGSEQRITVTDENRDILAKLDGKWGELDNTTNEFIINTVSKDIDTVIAAIKATDGISQSQKNQWISQLYKDQQSRATSAILSNAFNAVDNLDYETVAQLTDKFGQNFTNYNRTTGIFSLDLSALSQYLENLDKLPNLLNIRQDALEKAGLDNDSLRAARAQVASLIQSSSVYTRGNALISGRQNISETMINDFLNIADISENELMKYMTKEGDHWTMNDSQALAFAKRIGMTQKEIFETFATSTANAIDSLGGNIVSGFSNISDMQNIVDTINSHMDWVGRLFAGTPTIDALFEYNESLGKFILSTDGIAAYVNILRKQLDQATDAGQKEIVDGQIKQLQKQVKDAVNFDTIFETGRGAKTRENDRNELIRQLANVNAADEEAGKIIQENIKNLFTGGENAVNAAAAIYEALGKSFTVEDANKFARMNLSQVDAAREALDSNVGDYITQEAAALGVAAGYFVVSKPNSQGFVQILKKNKDNLEQALRQYYHALLANGEQDIDKLNEAILDIWEEQGNRISGQNDLLSKASGMTFREFGEGLAAIGVTLTENMLQEYIDSGLVEQIAGTNQVRVKDFEQFAKRIGVTDRTSKQYQDLYSEFVDSQIEDLASAQEAILSSASDISGAKAGDRLNISKAMAQFDKPTQMALQEYFISQGAAYADGILTISKDSKVFNIAETLLQAASKVKGIDADKIEDAVNELADAVQETLQKFIDALTSGIKGGITNAGRKDITSYAKTLGIELKDTDFIQAADGMKLTTAAAIELYNAVSQLGNANTSGLFDALKDSLLSRDNINTMDGILAKINSLQNQIDANTAKQASNVEAVNDKLQQELNLYHQIARQQMANPDNYNFMDKAMPEQYNSALNYWESTAKMMQTMTSSAKSGYMGVQDFYNIAQEMEHLSQLSGQTMKFMGVEIGEGAMTAADLIEQGMANLQYVEGKGMQINLKGLGEIGLNLASGAEDMAAGVEDGIHDMAKAQVSMLDGVISMLEVIVAMEGLEDITGEDNVIDLGDIFPDFAVNGDKHIKEGSVFDTYITQLDGLIKGDEKLAKKFEQFKIGGYSLVKIIDDLANKKELTLDGIDPKFLSNFFEQMRQMLSEEGFDILNDPEAVMKRIGLSGADTHYEYTVGKRTYTVHNGKTILKTDKGDGWIVDGETYTDFKKAYNAKVQSDVKKEIEQFNKNDATQEDIIVQNENGKSGTIHLAYQKYNFTVDDNGNYIYDGKTYANIDAMMAAVFQQTQKDLADWTPNEEYGKKYGEMTTWQQEIALGLKPTIKITSAQDFKNNPELLNRLISSGIGLDKLTAENNQLLKYQLGIEIDPNSPINQADIEQAIEEAKTVLLKPELEPINAKDIKVKGAIHVFAVIDGFVGPNGKINLRNGSGYSEIDPDENLRTVLGQTDDQTWEETYKKESWVRERYAPSGASYTTVAGRTEGKKLWERLQKEDKTLTDVETSAAEAYGKKFVEPIKTFLESEDYTNSVKQAEEQVRQSREQWKKEHNGSEEKYDYKQKDWYKEAFDKQEGTDKSLKDQYIDALKASGEYKNVMRSLGEKSRNPETGFVDWELYDSLLATQIKAWQAQNKENPSDTPDPYKDTTNGLNGLKSAAEGLSSVFSQITDLFSTLFGVKPKAPSNTNNTEQQEPDISSTQNQQPTSSDSKKSATQVLEDIRDIQSEISVKEGQRITLEDNQARQQKKLTELQAQKQAEIGIHTDQKQATSSVDGEIAIAENNLKNTTAGLALIDNQLSSLHTNLDNATASLASMPITDVLSALTTAITGLSGPASSAASAISSTAEALSRLRSRDVTVRVYAEVETQTKGTGNATISVETSGANNAKGNVALAGGTKTLMGELGPELVVSNGRYFIAGENGAEFVNLADDAIVFNHLQTQRLLKNGFSGRGKALTNERNATSLATGNVQGPAMASASAALAQLRQLRAQWEALANLSLVDLAKKGGGGGGGGSDKVIPGFMREVERWYNWLQKIADLEKQITYQEKLRSKIQSDMVSNGKAYYASQRKTYEDARASALTSESLFLQQKEYFNIRRQMLSDAPISSIYTFDESGQAHYKDEEAREWMERLFTSDKYGQMTLTPKQQYEMILARNPALADYMKYDKEGKEIKKSDYKQVDEYYLAMVEAFSDRLTSEQEEMQELFDSWNEQQQAVLEQMQTMNEQLQAMKDNQKEVENAVLDAIVESREREIQAMEDTRDAIEKTNEDFIDGLNKSLDKERQMYEDTQKDQELERNRRQLAILKRSGASASQIAQLQEKVDQQSRDQYFEKQQEQIDAVKEASDLQLEKLDTQIELAQEQLEYEKANGLLWGQVYQVMSGSANDIANFIKGNTEEWWSKSPLTSADDANKIIFQAEQWKAFSEDTDMQNASLGKINQNLDIFMGAMKEIYGKDVKWDEIEKTAQTKYEALFGPNNDDPGSTAWQAYQSATELATKPAISTTSEKTNTTTATTTGGGKNGKEKAWSYNKDYHYHKLWRNGSWSMADKAAHDFETTSKKDADGVFNGKKVEYYTVTKKCKICGYTTTEKDIREAKNINTAATAIDQRSINKTGNGTNTLSPGARILQAYASGGKNEYTGLAILHGTSSEPEGILNAEDYKAWKQDIKTTNLLYGALANVSAVQRSTAAAIGSTTNNETGINIENAVVNMNTTIANDYDARRAGEQALEQMLTIARKSGTRSAQRR